MADERGRFERWGFKIPLPRWAVAVVAGLAVVAAGAVVWNRLLEPILNPDTVDVPLEDLLQMEESMLHFSETPERTILLDGAAVSSWRDQCVSVTRPWGAGFVTRFNFHPSRIFPERAAGPPGPAVAVASLVPLGGGGDPCSRRCYDPHPGEFTTWQEGVNRCVVLVYRKWPEGCLHRQPYDACYNRWGPIHWLCCVH